MKEQFEYLIDEFGVELVINTEYAGKNNLHSMKLVSDHLANAYVVPCDIWCDKNPFRTAELYSWYMVSDLVDEQSDVRVNRKMELVRTSQTAGNAMIGIAYLTAEDAALVTERIVQLVEKAAYDDSFWEEALYKKDRMIVAARVVHACDVVEINTYEQLRDLDSDSEQLKSDAIAVIAKQLQADPKEIVEISVLKKA